MIVSRPLAPSALLLGLIENVMMLTLSDIVELERLQREEEELQEKRRRDKEAREAVDKYKKEEAERQLREKQEAERREREYQSKLRDHLLESGLDEKEINAILAGKKIVREKEEKKEKKDKEKEKEKDHGSKVRETVTTTTLTATQSPRPTYTRMARRHLSIETLRAYNIDYQLDVVSLFAQDIVLLSSVFIANHCFLQR